MLVLVVSVETTRENIDGIREALETMQAASRAEAGCHDYTFCVELNDPDKLRITECWEDQTALEAHFATPHMAAFNEAMAQAGQRSIEISCYEATEIPFPIQLGR
jgi:quinol monooxygenase YgiN